MEKEIRLVTLSEKPDFRLGVKKAPKRALPSKSQLATESGLYPK